MKHVLRVIESHIRERTTCRVKVDTIREEAGARSRSKIDRAIRGLKSLQVLSVRQTGASSIYQIIWSNLADFDPEEASPETSPESAGPGARPETGPKPAQTAERIGMVAAGNWHGANSELAQGQGRIGIVPIPNWHSANSTEAPLETQIKPPPPNALRAPTPAGGAAGGGAVSQAETAASGWAAVAGDLRSEGVAAVRATVEAARSNGYTPAGVQQVVAHFRDVRHSLGFGPGALKSRLCSGYPGDDPAAGWPLPQRPAQPAGSSRPQPELSRTGAVRALRKRLQSQGCDAAEIARQVLEFGG